jgi:hypothetical protein
MPKHWLSWSGVDSKLIRMSSRLIVPSVRKLDAWIELFVVHCRGASRFRSDERINRMIWRILESFNN